MAAAHRIPTIDVSRVQVRAIYNVAAGHTPSLSGTPAADWQDANIHTIQMWHNVQLTNAEITRMGPTFLTHLTTGSISSRTAATGLRLAMSLKTMEPGSDNLLLTLPPRPEEAGENELAIVSMPALANFSEVAFELRRPQLILEQGNPLAAGIEIGQEEEPQAQEGNGQDLPADTDFMSMRAYTYIAAYLMRLLVKDAPNAVRGINNMKAKFQSFYGPSRTIRGFTLTLPQAQAYKDALIGQSKISSTYTLSLAYTQNEASANHTEREVGLLSYLGYLQFSYTGLHAYTLMVELSNLSHAPLPRLLTLFQADVNQRALVKIAEIVNRYERTVENPTRSTYFRYCALWGAHYFEPIRSKNCPHLTYTVAHAWKMLSATNPNADPDKIAATAGLSEPMKRTLRYAGQIIGESLKNTMLGGPDVSNAYTIALQNPEGQDEDDQSDDEDWDTVLG
ncbi:TPA_asm: N [Argyranthemum gammacytorhabdovirus 1]|nr:TPA_asm: N [Argyranthemum gammacytorhabdovirus 1]